MLLQDKVAIITGAGGAIGRSIAHRFSQEGAALGLLDADGAALTELLPSLSPSKIEHQGYEVDITHSNAVRETIETAILHFGKIDILINNAGIVFRRTLFEITEQEWDQVYDVNVKGPFLLTQIVAHHMVRRGKGGKIVNVASIAGKIARGDKAHYASAKAALIHFSRCIAIELGPFGINVNAICPGPTVSPMISEPVDKAYIQKHNIVLGKIAQPEDQANTILFFASHQSDHITGQVINVDGGEVMF